MTQHFLCWDGPKAGELVTDVPMSVDLGHACALPWTTMVGKRKYAIYILLEKPNGDRGLVYEKRSYDKPYQAEQRVRNITQAVEAMRGKPRTMIGSA